MAFIVDFPFYCILLYKHTYYCCISQTVVSYFSFRFSLLAFLSTKLELRCSTLFCDDFCLTNYTRLKLNNSHFFYNQYRPFSSSTLAKLYCILTALELIFSTYSTHSSWFFHYAIVVESLNVKLYMFMYIYTCWSLISFSYFILNSIFSTSNLTMQWVAVTQYLVFNGNLTWNLNTQRCIYILVYEYISDGLPFTVL